MNDSPFIDIDDRIRLLGTAHVAQKSVDAVAFHVTEFQPTTVAVELCESRKEALTQQRRLDKESLLKVIKEGKAPLVLIQSLLAAEQRKIGMNEGVQPGEELLKAVQVAEEHELPVALVDRDIQTTLRRAWKNMGFREKISLFSALIFDEEEEEIDLNEVLSDQDLLSSLMLELKEISPGAGEVLVDERDEYIARKIASIDSEQKVLAVLGAGHLEGVAKYLKEGFSNEENRLEALDTIPKKTFFAKSFPWLIPMALFGVMAWLFTQGNVDAIWKAGGIWLASNALAAALCCALAGGHPLSILTAALASPITSLNPMLAAGWFAGYVQMKIKEPTAEDLQLFLKLDEFSLFWKNRAGRVLLVTALTNIGSMLGAWISAGIIAAGL